MKFKKIDVKQSDVLQSLKDVGIEIVPDSKQKGVCIVDLNGESYCLPHDFSIFDDYQMTVKYALTNMFDYYHINCLDINKIKFQTAATKLFVPIESSCLTSPAA